MDQSFVLGAVEVRPVERELRIDGQRVAIGARAFDVLLALLERRHRVVTKNELLDLVWPDIVVDENSVQAQVSQLRKVLGPKAIATIPGRGYRFALPVGNEERVRTGVFPAFGNASVGGMERVVGREVDLEAVMTLLDQHRLVTIAGTGGIGKTTLANAVVVQRAGRHAHGVAWVDLTSITSPEKIATAIANAADLHLGEGPAQTLLGRAIAGRDMMIVLDNCEHLVKGVAQLIPAMQAAAPRLSILATSQEVLQVAGECVYRLESLGVPPAGTPLAVARKYPALELLVQRAMTADTRFTLSQENLAGAIELCRRLDGIPLAIEMAGARLPVLGAEALLARLDERLRLLRSTLRHAPQRQQTLQATLDWSHSLLTPAEQAVFRRLSVFVGGFWLESAQKVSGWGALDEWSALDALMGLVDKSLVRVESGSVPRYRLLESARLYGLEQLVKHDEVEASYDRHGLAMKTLGDSGRRAYWLMTERPSLEQWYDDYEDLQAAFDRAAEVKDPAVAGSTGILLCAIDFERNVYANVRRRKEMAYSLLSFADPVARAMLLHVVSHFHALLLPEMDRVALEEERIALYRSFGRLGSGPAGAMKANRQVYFSLARLASDYAIAGRVEESKAALEEAVALEDPAWPPHFRWFLAYGARKAAVYWDDAAEMRHWSARMLELARSAKWPPRIAESLNACAVAAFISGDVGEALRLAEHSVGELRRLNQPINLFDALVVMGAAHVQRGDLGAACAAATEALALPWQRELATPCFDLVGLLAALAGRHPQAALLFGFADRGYEMSQDRRHSIGAWAERDGVARIRSEIGPEMHARLREAGGELSDAQVQEVAREALADGGVEVNPPLREAPPLRPDAVRG